MLIYISLHKIKKNNKYRKEKTERDIEISFDDKYNNISHKNVIKKSNDDGTILVKLVNSSDKFERELLLNSYFTVSQLKLLITFFYQIKLCPMEVGKISLFCFDSKKKDIEINDDESTMKELFESFGVKYKLNIFFTVDFK